MTDADIVGYIVFSKDIANAALYPLAEKDEAFSAAKRWNASISALVMHPKAPALAGSAQEEGRDDYDKRMLGQKYAGDKLDDLVPPARGEEGR
jgi:hypothetical protein